MKPQAFQPGELRDEHDQIIRAGVYGKKTPFVSSDNNAILDYIMNNFDALYAQIPNGRAYVKSVNNITPDSNGNVTINLGSGGGGGTGTNITVDSALSSISTNPVQNKVLYAALNDKLDKTGIAAYATRDDFGNIIADTYAKKSEVSGVVKSVNNITPDSNGNVTINLGGGGGTGGTNITVDSTLSSTSTNPVQNKVIYVALSNKLDKNGTATYATCDSSGNIISNTYARKSDLSGYVKSINNVKPDSAGNVNISTSGGGSNITVDATLDSTSSNAIANKAVYAALNNKLDKTGIAAYATRDDFGNIIADTYAKKSEVSGVVKSVNNIAPDSNGNVTITVSGGGGGGSGDYLPLTGGTVTGGITATNFQTGTGAANYFQCRKFRSEGNANSYYHAIDFGYSGHDSVDFYEYDPNWNFYKCTSGTKSSAVLVGNINGNGWNGGARLTGAPTAPTAAVGTNTTQIATTEFVQAAIPTNVSSFTNDAGYIKSVNNIKPDSNGNVNISTSSGGGGGVSTSVANTWTAQQNFQRLKFNFESFATSRISGTYNSPAKSVAIYNVTGALTLDMSTLAGMISNGDTSIFTAYIASNGSYALSITNAGTLKYAGSAVDLAITASGLLLNIFLTKNASGVVTSIAQATKLS